MKKKFIIAVAGIAVIAISVIVTISSVNARSTESDLLTANIEALTRDEGSGLLWDKEWTSCPIAEQVIVHYDCGGLRAGVYYYAAVSGQLWNCGGSYTVVSAHEGRKSYCYDGWEFCSKNDCR